MAEVTDYVKVTLILSDASPGIPNFGAMLVLASSADADAGAMQFSATPAGVKAYLTDHGGKAGDPAAVLMDSIVSQTPHVDKINVYNPKHTTALDYSITPVGAFNEGDKYSLDINGTTITATCDADSSAAEIATALVALVDALPGVNATDDTGAFTLTQSGTEPLRLHGVDYSRFEVSVKSVVTGSVSDALNAAVLAEVDFYGFVMDHEDDVSIAAAAAWAEANRKICILRTKDADSVAGNGVLDTLFSAGYHRTVLAVSTSDAARLDAASLGQFLSTQPGAWDLQFKQHPPIVADKFTTAQISAIKDKNGMPYTRTSGVAFTDNGVAVSGRSLYVTRNVDWLQARFEQEVLTVLLENPVINIDLPGIAKFEAAYGRVLAEAERKNVILPGWTLTPPELDEISTADKNNGVIPGFVATATTGKPTRRVELEITLN